MKMKWMARGTTATAMVALAPTTDGLVRNRTARLSRGLGLVRCEAGFRRGAGTLCADDSATAPYIAAELGAVRCGFGGPSAAAAVVLLAVPASEAILVITARQASA